MGLQFASGDLLLLNGRIYPGPHWDQHTGALSIEDGVVTAHGQQALDRKSRFSPDQVVDLGNSIVLPGFIDSHLHLTSLAQSLTQLSFQESTGAEEIQRLVQQQADHAAPGEWVVGGSWSRHTLNGFPDKSLLDQVAPDNPVALHSKDLHSILLNSVALRQLDIDSGTSDPAGGEIMRDASGEPTGLLLENAVYLYEDRRPRPDSDEFRRQHQRVSAHCWKHGITGVHAVELMPDWNYYEQLHERGELGLRVGGLLPVEELDEISWRGYRSGQGDNALWIVGIKIYADGALGSCTAWMKEPYTDSDDRGVALKSGEEIVGCIRRSHEAGLSVGVHAIGDAAVLQTLTALRANSSRDVEVLLDRIEHFQLIDPGDFKVIPENLIGAVQPSHLPGDRDDADRVWGTRSRYAYAFRSLRSNGVTLSFGSDAPVEDVDPWKGIQAAVDRRGSAERAPWHPEERISLEEALTAYTYHSGIAGYRKGRHGSLQVGAFGDAVVLSGDPWKVPSSGLATTRPAMTIVNGCIVFSNE